ncbi:MAG: hypothetical protein NT154_42980 [Verrucomicrobia bacterium]|nr:hypothetical protein [Verrucomicrobiota bacterium]
MNIRYESNRTISDEEFVDLLKRSTLAERRPGDDPKCIRASSLGRKAKIILLAAPKAEGYYPRIGFDGHRSAWILSAAKSLK